MIIKKSGIIAIENGDGLDAIVYHNEAKRAFEFFLVERADMEQIQTLLEELNTNEK